ncbi:MAG: futalosine hydrolase [Nitrospirae bacterium]|nr:futalosine hydrolase [Nitrospirota bacterium]
MKFLAILTAVPFESELILKQMKNVRNIKTAGKIVFKGKLLNQHVLLMNSGIGKVNAAHSSTLILENYPVKCMINSGVGGAYPNSGLKIGDIAIALKEIYGDDGVIAPTGWKDLKEIGIPLLQIGMRRYFNEFPLNQAAQIPVNSGKGFQIKRGVFVTVSSVTGTHQRALELENRFNAICENMEGAAIAHICAMHKVPLLEIRGISNIAGIRDKRRWNLSLASENCQQTVLEIIPYLR